jgi:hypothetical protein
MYGRDDVGNDEKYVPSQLQKAAAHHRMPFSPSSNGGSAALVAGCIKWVQEPEKRGSVNVSTSTIFQFVLLTLKRRFSKTNSKNIQLRTLPILTVAMTNGAYRGCLMCFWLMFGPLRCFSS